MSSINTTTDRTESQGVGAGLLYDLAFYSLLILFALFFILPLVWMVVTSIKPFQEWLMPNWIPLNPTLDSFRSLFADPTLPMDSWFLNSLIIATVFTLLVLALDALAAYAYARMQFRGRNLLFGLLLATLVMPGVMFLIPNFITVTRLGWLGTFQGVIAPGLSGVFGVFFLRQFFQSIPVELEEAAYIDGAGTWRTFFSVVLPLSRGALATLGVITFMESWNSFLWPLLILGNVREMQTLPVGLATLQGQYTFDYGKLMAGAVVTTIPVLLLFVLLQRYIVQSIAMTGLKG